MLSMQAHLSFGAPCLSGRVLDSRLRGSRFEPHRRHCVVFFRKTLCPLLRLVQPSKTCPAMTEKMLTGI